MTNVPTIPPSFNKLMTFVLRSPAHGVVSKSLLLISFTGRKSGKTYTTPVSYSQSGQIVTIFTHSGWWKNLQGEAPVTVRIRGQDYQGLAEATAADKQRVAAGLAEHLRKVPGDGRFYNVTFDEQGNPRPDEVQRAAQEVVMVSVRLC